MNDPRVTILPPARRTQRAANPRQLGSLTSDIQGVEGYATSMGLGAGAGFLFGGPIGAVVGAGAGYVLGTFQDQSGSGNSSGSGVLSELTSGNTGMILLLGGLLAVIFYADKK